MSNEFDNNKIKNSCQVWSKNNIRNVGRNWKPKEDSEFIDFIWKFNFANALLNIKLCTLYIDKNPFGEDQTEKKEKICCMAPLVFDSKLEFDLLELVNNIQ